MFVIVDTDLGAADAVRQYLLPNPDVCGANFTVDWATVDHGPGAAPRYDWSAIAAQIAPWEQAGKVVNLVFVGAAEGAGPQTATPSYVMKQVTTIDCGPSGRPTPVFWQPGYEKNWEAFIAAAVSHFTPDRHVGYLRFGLGLGAEDFVTGEASKACTDQWDKAGLQTDWAPYNQRLIAFEGSLHSSVQLMIAINPNQGKATLAMVNTKQAVAEGIGFGNQGLAADDVTAINNRTPCPNADWCNLFSMYSGKVPLEEQTLAASDPAPNVSAAADLKIGPNSPRTGPLPALLQVALREHTQIFELYVQDLLMAFDPAWPGYSEYHRAYAEALASTASIVGTFEGADPVAETSAASVPGSGTATANMTPHGGPLGALYDAIQVYQDQQGIPAVNYQAAATVATVDQTWAYFTIRPTAAAKNSLQGGYGYARLTNGGWSVVAFGTEGVGCASRPPVPTRVRQEFAAGQPCP